MARGQLEVSNLACIRSLPRVMLWNKGPRSFRDQVSRMAVLAMYAPKVPSPWIQNHRPRHCGVLPSFWSPEGGPFFRQKSVWKTERDHQDSGPAIGLDRCNFSRGLSFWMRWLSQCHHHHKNKTVPESWLLCGVYVLWADQTFVDRSIVAFLITHNHSSYSFHFQSSMCG